MRQQNGHRARSGFTMVEVLIVILVIAVLGSMLLGVVFSLREKAEILATSKRMQDLMTQLGSQGLNKGGPAFHYARSFGLSLEDGSANPTDTEMENALLALGPSSPSNSHYDNYVSSTVMGQFGSWGTDTSVWSSITWGVGPDSDHPTNPSVNQKPDAYVSNNPWGKPKLLMDDGSRNDIGEKEEINIRQFNPLLSFFFFWQAGVFPPDDPGTTGVYEPLQAYLSDRKAEQPWNDRWGNPIVASYLLFEPRDEAWPRVVDADSLGDTDDPNFSQQELWARANKAFGFNRLLYMTCAAAGPQLRKGSSTGGNVVPAIWDHVLWVVSDGDDSDELWDENSFSEPPWENIVAEEKGNYMGFLAAPFELK